MVVNALLGLALAEVMGDGLGTGVGQSTHVVRSPGQRQVSTSAGQGGHHGTAGADATMGYVVGTRAGTARTVCD